MDAKIQRKDYSMWCKVLCTDFSSKIYNDFEMQYWSAELSIIPLPDWKIDWGPSNSKQMQTFQDYFSVKLKKKNLQRT